MLSRISCFFSFLLARIRDLQSPTILLLRGLYSIIVNVTSLSLNVERSLTYTSETRLAGMNTLVSSIITPRPPFMICVTLAVSTVWFSNASSSFLLPASAIIFLYERTTCPSPSLILITFVFISSPILATVLRSRLLSDEYSFLVTMPSDLYPMLRIISSSLTSITVPSTISPVCIVLKFSFSNSSKLCSDTGVNLLNYVVWG